MSSLKKSIKINSPLPKDLAGECKKASKILNAFVDPIAAKGIDNVIPSDILIKAKGLAIFTVIKAGFLFSGRAGAGIVVARLEDGSWSAPSAIGTGGMGFGGQIGAEITDFVIVLNTRSAVKSFSSGGNVTLGGNLSVAAGPIGRTAEAGASATVGSFAAIYSYSKTKGLFAGVSIEGSIIMERKDANGAFYRGPVSAADLLSGAVPPPPQADILYRALNSKASGAYGNQRSPTFGDDFVSSTSINRSVSSIQPRRYGNNQEGVGGSGSPSGVARSTTVGYAANEYSRRPNNAGSGTPENDEPLPRYSPTVFSKPEVTKPASGLYGRPSIDSNSPFHASQTHANQTHVNQTMSNSRGPAPKVPPKIGAKPDIVVAMYDFAGEETTDLSFKKGDRITVIKKTPSKNDWWTGKCNGREGSFPANYVQ
ncbi:hypothetical protein BG011_009264 [Mortierella polycephala]|uniref:SH3 domain-containing protein n=1 Tax=Mortierella polycephala TaxID=41804 RepID=A0A9P6PPN5_9FUNG|nr:hypothetical protein BG011_009264 [Mortierella polycephala]